MANRDAAFGLRPVRHLNGNPWNGQTKKFLIEDEHTEATFIGDPMVLEGEIGSDDTTGIYPTVVNATAGSGNVCHGIVMSFDLIGATGLVEDTVYNPAYTSRYVNLCIDPDVIFIIQDNADSATTVDIIGGNVDYEYTAGSIATGLSAWELDVDTVSTTPADNLVILGVWPEEGNALGNWCIWEVLISNHGFRCKTGITGV